MTAKQVVNGRELINTYRTVLGILKQVQKYPAFFSFRLVN